MVVMAPGWGLQLTLALAPCRSLLVVAISWSLLSTTRSSRRCLEQRLVFGLSSLDSAGSGRPPGDSGALLSIILANFSVFFWPPAGCLVLAVRCTARGHVLPAIHIRVPSYTLGTPAP